VDDDSVSICCYEVERLVDLNEPATGAEASECFSLVRSACLVTIPPAVVAIVRDFKAAASPAAAQVTSATSVLAVAARC
jgi:hypothetical protein